MFLQFVLFVEFLKRKKKLERQSNIVFLETYYLKDVINEHLKDSDIITKYSTENEDIFRE